MKVFYERTRRLYLYLDIETIERSMPSGMLAQATARIEAKNKARYKTEETIVKHIAEDIEKFKNRWKFSENGAKVVCVCVGQSAGLHDEPEINTFYAEDERVLLGGLCMFLDRVGSVDRVFTYNGTRFDLPVLVAAMRRNDVRLENRIPAHLFKDLCYEPYGKYRSDSASLDDVCATYGITLPAADLGGFSDSGAMIADMFAADMMGVDGRSDRVPNKCSRDVRKLHAVASAMGGLIAL